MSHGNISPLGYSTRLSRLTSLGCETVDGFFLPRGTHGWDTWGEGGRESVFAILCLLD